MFRPSLGALDVKLQHMVFCTQFYVGGGPESRCVGPVYGLDGAVRRHHPNRPNLLLQAGISLYFTMKMHGQTTLKNTTDVQDEEWLFKKF